MTDNPEGSPGDPTFNDYDAFADAFIERYESVAFKEVHRELIARLPKYHAWVLDVGAGSGRDAAALAGDFHHRVVAVEPSAAMREGAIARHPHPNIRWLDDRLPELSGVRRLNESFDLILLSAVWMHVRPEEREVAMGNLASLMRPGANLALSFKSLPDGARQMWPVVASEVERHAHNVGLDLVASSQSADRLGREEITWTTLVFRRRDDGSSALPILRNIIINDDKTATYKFALLRVLSRIAATAPGLASNTREGDVRVPLGLLSLYWLKTYWQLVERGVRQSTQSKLRFGAAMRRLIRAGVLSVELDVGASYSGEAASALYGALVKVRETLQTGPMKHTTYWNSTQPIFIYEGKRRPKEARQIALSRDYLESWGYARVPRDIWEAMRSHWVWIEPAVVSAWVEMTIDLAGGSHIHPAQTYQEWLEWPVDLERDTSVARARVDGLDGLSCVWTGKTLGATYEVDHIIPYSVSGNNTLWNLAPATRVANNSKSARLPSAGLLLAARARLIDWWRRAYVEDPRLASRFWREAERYIPEYRYDPSRGVEENLSEVFEGVEWHIARVRRDQQIANWSPS
jgi:SAM-dependent methyltransferase